MKYFFDQQSGGFTLFELMITASMIMVLVSVSLVSLQSFRKNLLSSEADLLHSTCTYLQQMALTTHTQQELVFDPTHHRYFWRDGEHTLCTGVEFGVTPDAKGPPSSPHASLVRPITFAGDKIVFYPDGIVSAGSVYLTDYEKQELYALTNSASHVSYLRRYFYDGKWHVRN